ncbi:MAG: 2-oxo-4-hydroxy-4-carboxy-5-ureidoimidazoline decarboxylase [Paraglaciecola sp.]|nr:2-oxo-4-hydroxy-4-carboxy-5-ureidoimidazoline decarboxylase [Paraglaciecola sp.]NCT48484.1 2-oxo-4-hydroxy-4-carboxy-5-ureidoimidazoline decarboxylase [Paraglaciecola sp.]
MTLNELNTCNNKLAFTWFNQCCAADTWCQSMLAKRPFASLEALAKTAEQTWAECNDTDYLQAFEGHPMIGDVASLRKKYASTQGLASHEQSGVQGADEATLTALHALNQKYLAKHGFIFIICATGLSAQAMLDALRQRFDHDTATEIELAALEQLKITLLRIHKGLAE